MPGKDKVIKSYRAGSGNGSKDECAPMRGWLPNGSCKVLGHEKHKKGGRSGINGYAIHVQDGSARTAGPSGPSCSSTAR